MGRSQLARARSLRFVRGLFYRPSGPYAHLALGRLAGPPAAQGLRVSVRISWDTREMTVSVRPFARGLMLCERVIVEEGTHNVSPVNSFTRRNVERIPSPPLEFDVFASLAEGRGTITMTFRICRSDTAAVILLSETSVA